MNMQLKGVVLPFSFELNEQEGEYSILISNAEERINIDGVRVFKDSIQFKMPVFESEFFLKVHAADSLSGHWINYYKSDDYIIDVWATTTKDSRFKGFSQTNKIPYKLHSKYEVEFSPNEDGAYKAIGLFEQDGDWVKGTFATETGDYRYLEGRVIGDSLFLSTFDGSHAFYFSAGIKDSTLEGVFISGIHHRENWVARQNSDFELRDPDSLTSLTDSSAISFSLPNSNGEVLSLGDSRFQNKVKIIQIMGSWCPNCLDESRYFNSLYDKYAENGLEIIALAFERTRSEVQAINNLQRLSEKENLSYPILLAGYNRDQHPRNIFPMLDKIMSYPTTLFLDKENRVRRIHTGFYGPGTGEYYDAYRAETESFIEELLAED
tara:strand:+ start:716 stop:1852 length:1137 start_codon:yes stop_codon:yes gene_type:complete